MKDKVEFKDPKPGPVITFQGDYTIVITLFRPVSTQEGKLLYADQLLDALSELNQV